MNNINQCYEILGLKPDTSPEEVKQAYRDLAFVWHPDRFPNNPRLKEKAQEELKKINTAYEVLKSYQFSISPNTKPPSSSKAKTSQASPPNTNSSSSVDAKTYYERGMEKARKGKYKEAIADFLRAILINPNYAEAYKYRGLAYSKLEDSQKAIEDFKNAADIYLKQGNKNDRQDILERIKKLQTSEPDTSLKKDYRKLQALLAVGNWQEADRETRSVMLKIAGREKESWLSEENIKNFPYEELRTIDSLWRKSSNGRFGFSIQKHIWQSLGTKNTDYPNWCRFGDNVGWRMKGFWVFSYEDLTFTLDAPVGHLPLLSPSLNGIVQWGSWSGLFLLSRQD